LRFIAFAGFEIKRMVKRPSSAILMFLIPLAVVVISLLFFNSFNLSNIKLGILNLDKDPLSRFTVGIVMSLFKGQTLFDVGSNYKDELLEGRYHAVIIIPKNFSSDLYDAKRTEIGFVPSPVDIQLSATIYQVFNSMFEDLEGSPFFNPKVLGYLFAGQGYPAPRLVMKENEEILSVSSLIAPVTLFLSAAVIVLAIGVNNTVEDREIGLLEQYTHMNLSAVEYISGKVIALSLIGVIESLGAYVLLLLFGVKVPLLTLLILSSASAVFHSSLGLFVSSCAPSIKVGSIAGTGLVVLSFFLSGVIVPISVLPNFLKKLSNISPLFLANLAVRKQEIYGISPTHEFTFVILAALVMFAIALFSSSIILRRH